MATTITNGTIHKLPNDFKQAILKSPKAYTAWEDITPLARNEWICWVTSAKKQDTRERRVKAGVSKLNSAMRRPCCWVGCIHRG